MRREQKGIKELDYKDKNKRRYYQNSVDSKLDNSIWIICGRSKLSG